jgi:hypothetical protein
VALEHVRKALLNDGSVLTRLEEGFIRTSCHILGIPAEAMMRVNVASVAWIMGRGDDVVHVADTEGGIG